MPIKVAILAALPREISALVRDLRPDPAWRAEGVLLYRRPDALVVAAGMGSLRVTRALEAALAAGPVQKVISAGLAGACAPALLPGTVVEPAGVVDARTGERFSTTDSAGGTLLVSTEAIASVREKARLHATYRADLVDMEAATVARLAQAHGLELQLVKGISDAHDFELESLARFTGKQGHFRTARFALHTAARPQTWKAAMHLGRNSSRALTGMAIRLRAILKSER